MKQKKKKKRGGRKLWYYFDFWRFKGFSVRQFGRLSRQRKVKIQPIQERLFIVH